LDWDSQSLYSPESRALFTRHFTPPACPPSKRCAMTSSLTENTVCHPSGPTTPMLQIVNVTRIYDDGHVCALANVSLVIQSGEYLAIMGPSGSGKSTLLNLLGALDQPTSGDILFEGASLRALRDLDHFRASTLGFIFQSFYLLPTLTALENVQIPMFETALNSRRRAQRAGELLELVGMTPRAHHLPKQLSVGERQRVAIARALANGPKLLLADEPTGNLDSAAGNVVLDLFDRLHRERSLTLVVITHDPQVAARAQRTVWIRDGQLHNS
jgi:putative ABC transport system ATP-binding protein